MDEEKGFVIKDKRFSSPESGDDADSVKTKDDAVDPEEKKEEPVRKESAQEEPVQKDSDRDQALPKVNFPTFIISMSSSVLMHLGEIADPATGVTAVNLPIAKQTIDILALLEEKTKGNLSEDEAKLLQNVLYDLRMRYVALKKK